MKTKSELRAILFWHLDGIATASVVFSLHKKGVLTFLLEYKKAMLKQLVSHFKANEGYLNVALRVLASLGWLVQILDNEKDEISYSLTDNSEIAFSLIPIYNDVVDIIQYSENFDPRKFELELFQKLNALFEKYK